MFMGLSSALYSGEGGTYFDRFVVIALGLARLLCDGLRCNNLPRGKTMLYCCLLRCFAKVYKSSAKNLNFLLVFISMCNKCISTLIIFWKESQVQVAEIYIANIKV